MEKKFFFNLNPLVRIMFEPGKKETRCRLSSAAYKKGQLPGESHRTVGRAGRVKCSVF